MAQCNGITLRGLRCSRRAIQGGLLCGIHVHVYLRHQDHMRETIYADLEDEDDRAYGIRDVVLLPRLVRGDTDIAGMHQIVADALHAGVIGHWWAEHLNHFIDEAEPPTVLQQLSADAQNVHTQPVVQQTNSATAKLLEADSQSASDISTPDFIERIRSMIPASMKQSKRLLLKDITTWFNVSECRVKDDWLYRRCMRGALSIIDRSSHKEDLSIRLIEECAESIGVCCEGHISRIVNVFVGFDDAFVPEVSVGQLLQDKMSIIALKDISVEYKVGEAWAVFEELGIPMSERDVWIDAF